MQNLSSLHAPENKIEKEKNRKDREGHSPNA